MFRHLAVLTAVLLGAYGIFRWASQASVPEVHLAPAPVSAGFKLQTPHPTSRQSAPVAKPYAEVPPPAPAAPQRPPALASTEAPEKRVAELKKKLAVDPENPAVLYELGITLAKELHVPQEGIPYLEKSLRKEGSNGVAFYDLVGAYLESGNVERGTAFFEELMKSDHVSKAAGYAALGDLRAASGDPLGAIGFVQKSLDAEPNSPSVLAMMGSMQQQAGDPRADETRKMAVQMLLSQIEQTKAAGQPVEMLQRDLIEIQRDRADGLFQNGRLDELEEMSSTATGPLKKHIEALLKHPRGNG